MGSISQHLFVGCVKEKICPTGFALQQHSHGNPTICRCIPYFKKAPSNSQLCCTTRVFPQSSLPVKKKKPACAIGGATRCGKGRRTSRHAGESAPGLDACTSVSKYCLNTLKCNGIRLCPYDFTFVTCVSLNHVIFLAK